MGNLEHNIKEAFAAQDAKTKLADKGGMWNRLDSTMGRKGVAAFWRVAAVLLGVFLLTGAFAAFNMGAKQHTELKNVEMQNVALIATVDSLLALPASIETKLQVIEKEKVVYRDRPVLQQNASAEGYWKEKYKVMADSSNQILASNRTHLQKISLLEQELTLAKTKLLKLEQGLMQEKEKETTAPFELKSERVEIGISKKPAVKTPEMEMKVFQKNFIENRNNLNSTIFKK